MILGLPGNESSVAEPNSSTSTTDCSLLLKQLRQRTIAADELISLLAEYRLLPQLLRELVIEDTIAAVPYSVEEGRQAGKQFCEQNHITSPDDRQAWLDKQRLTQTQLDAKIARTLRLEKFKRATWGPKLEAYFIKRKGQLDRVIYSLIRVKEPAIAQELYFRIAAGEQSFADVARQYSQGPEAQTGGLIGPMELSTPHPLLAQKLASSQPGQLLPPTRLNDWFVIARLEQFLPAQFDHPTRKRLLDELFERWMQERVNQLEQELLQPMAVPG